MGDMTTITLNARRYAIEYMLTHAKELGISGALFSKVQKIAIEFENKTFEKSRTVEEYARKIHETFYQFKEKMLEKRSQSSAQQQGQMSANQQPNGVANPPAMNNNPQQTVGVPQPQMPGQSSEQGHLTSPVSQQAMLKQQHRMRAVQQHRRIVQQRQNQDANMQRQPQQNHSQDNNHQQNHHQAPALQQQNHTQENHPQANHPQENHHQASHPQAPGLQQQNQPQENHLQYGHTFLQQGYLQPEVYPHKGMYSQPAMDNMQVSTANQRRVSNPNQTQFVQHGIDQCDVSSGKASQGMMMPSSADSLLREHDLRMKKAMPQEIASQGSPENYLPPNPEQHHQNNVVTDQWQNSDALTEYLHREQIKLIQELEQNPSRVQNAGNPELAPPSAPQPPKTASQETSAKQTGKQGKKQKAPAQKNPRGRKRKNQNTTPNDNKNQDQQVPEQNMQLGDNTQQQGGGNNNSLLQPGVSSGDIIQQPQPYVQALHPMERQPQAISLSNNSGISNNSYVRQQMGAVKNQRLGLLDKNTVDSNKEHFAKLGEIWNTIGAKAKELQSNPQSVTEADQPFLMASTQCYRLMKSVTSLKSKYRNGSLSHEEFTILVEKVKQFVSTFRLSQISPNNSQGIENPNSTLLGETMREGNVMGYQQQHPTVMNELHGLQRNSQEFLHPQITQSAFLKEQPSEVAAPPNKNSNIECFDENPGGTENPNNRLLGEPNTAAYVVPSQNTRAETPKDLPVECHQDNQSSVCDHDEPEAVKKNIELQGHSPTAKEITTEVGKKEQEDKPGTEFEVESSAVLDGTTASASSDQTYEDHAKVMRAYSMKIESFLEDSPIAMMQTAPPNTFRGMTEYEAMFVEAGFSLDDIPVPAPSPFEQAMLDKARRIQERLGWI